MTGAVTYHLAARDYYESLDPAAPYVPEAYEADGFIHCTDGIANVVDVGNRYYRDDPREYIVLVIEPSRVTAEIRYDEPGSVYPHIYGPLDRAAIVDVVEAPRAPGGEFLAPPIA